MDRYRAILNKVDGEVVADMVKGVCAGYYLADDVDKRIAELEAKLVRVLEWHEVSCYDELPFVIDELREGETALNGEGK